MTNLAYRAEPRRPSRWTADTPIYPGGQARFGQLTWDLNDQRHYVNRAPTHFVCRFNKLPETWQLLAREVCMCQVDTRTLRRELGVLRRQPAAPRTMCTLTIRLRGMAKWAEAAGLGLPATWDQDICDAYLRHVAARQSHPRGIEQAAELVRCLWSIGPLLSDGGLGFEPWPGLATRDALKLLGFPSASGDGGCATPVLPVEAFVPVMAAAFAYTEVFAGDIIAAWRLRQLGDPNLGAKGPRALHLLREWADKPDNRVPLLGDVAARQATRRRGCANTGPEAPNWSMVARLTGVQLKMFMPSYATCDEARSVIEAMVNQGRVISGGFYAPAAQVEHPDGSRRPWRPPYSTVKEVWVDVWTLRTAAAIVLLALTGMRDSECQDLQRDALHEHYGTQALRTHRFKQRFGPEPVSWWVSDEALTAYRVLEQISEHPTHVIASLSNLDGSVRAGARLSFGRFVERVNADRVETGLPEIPAMVQFSPQVLRETFAYYLGRSHELGDIITGFQFGHTKATVTASYQRYRPDDSWNEAFRRGNLDGEIALLDSLAEFTGEPGSIVGRHGDELRAVALELRATILTDLEAGRRIAARHAETWHHGEVLSCRFDRSTAVCHKLAATAGITDPGDGPLHDLCIGSGCVNVHFTRRNLAPLLRQRAEIADRLAAAPSGSVAQLQARDDLDRVDKVIAQLKPVYGKED